MESRNSTLAPLPDELWLKIFSELDAKSLVNAQLACILFNNFGDNEALWKALCDKQAPVEATSYTKDDNSTDAFFGTSYKTFYAHYLPKDHLFAVVGPIDNLN